jgi:hypothetical protein
VLPEQPKAGRHAYGREAGQEDMKELMIDVANRTYPFPSVLASSNGSEVIEILKESDMVPKWNDPEMPEEVLRNAKRAYDAIRRALPHTACGGVIDGSVFPSAEKRLHSSTLSCD